MRRPHSQLPFLSVNMAMTVDGKIATAEGKLSSFGSKADHHRLLELRARADAVMAGARTVDANPIDMGPGPARFRRLRQKRGLSEYNLRVVVSRRGSLNPEAEIFRHRISPVIVLTTEQISSGRRKALSAAADCVHICGRREIDFEKAFVWLKSRWNVRRLLCEGGGELNGALFAGGWVDELHLTICPWLFGGRAAPTIAEGSGAINLPDATRFRIHSMKRVGQELFLTCRAARSS